MQLPDVREEMVENFWPQYLHAYWDFSLPSYLLPLVIRRIIRQMDGKEQM